MFSNSPIHCSVPLDTDGKHFGALHLTVSDDEHGGATIPIPIVVLKNGDGPTTLICGGNHGNEDEGQIVVRRLVAELDPADIAGRLILLPSLNLPAVRAHRRVSPIDAGNLNRSFPGAPDAGPTSSIAHFLTTRLMPLCDAGIDLHSGGPTNEIIVSTYLGIGSNGDVTRRSLELVRAFGLPHVLVCDDGGVGMDDAAHAQGLAFISAELGGGASANAASLEAGYNAVRRVLVHMGNLAQSGDIPLPADTTLLDFRRTGTVQAPFSGLFWPLAELEDTVAQGDLAGHLYAFEEIDRPPVELRFPADGLVCLKHAMSRVRHGDILFVTAPEVSTDEIPGQVD